MQHARIRLQVKHYLPILTVRAKLITSQKKTGNVRIK